MKTIEVKLSRTALIGICLLVFGSGPLLIIILLAKLGVTSDPNPNPIGPGMLAMFTFMPGIGLTLKGLKEGRGSVPSTEPEKKQEN